MNPLIHKAVQTVAEASEAVGLCEQVSPEQAETRLLICKQCQFLNTDETCQECGCFMPDKVLWGKLWGGEVTCPRGFW